MKIVLVITMAIIVLVGCQGVATKNTDPETRQAASEIMEVSPTDAQAAVSKAYAQFVDVRTPEEYSGGHAARAVNLPLDILSTKLDTLEKNEPVYLICQTGNRSRKAAAMLKDAGFNTVLNVTGGTVAWQAAKLPMETKPPHQPSGN